MAKIKYRPDIDSLRTIAVISVIIGHINAQLLPGGFLGVDIFFVISGYLITLLLIKEVRNSGTINIVKFYRRRVLRVMPALLLVLGTTYIISFFFLAPPDLLKYTKSVLWSYIFSANIYFYKNVDTSYFAEPSGELPLLHLWSLGIEEQFYIMWPIAVLVLFTAIKSIKWRLSILTIIFIASLSLAQTYVFTHQSFTYYIIFTRAWELIAGGIVAVLTSSNIQLPPKLSRVLAPISFLGLTLSLFLVHEESGVPGLAAFPIIFCTALLIHIHEKTDTFIKKLLSFKALVSAGLLSYSAYLWHWPILAYTRYALFEIDVYVSIIIFVLSFSLAYMSYRFVESPFRRSNLPNSKVFSYYFLLPGILFLVFQITTRELYRNDFLPFFSTQDFKKTIPALHFDDVCQTGLFEDKDFDNPNCIFPRDTPRTQRLLAGDSNAAHFVGFLQSLAVEMNFSFYNIAQSACPPLIEFNSNYVRPKFAEACERYRLALKKRLKTYDILYLGASWTEYYKSQTFKKDLQLTLEYLSKNIEKVVLLGKVPTADKFNKNCLMRSTRIPFINCSEKFKFKQKDHDVNLFIENLAADYENVFYFSVRTAMCQGDECSSHIEGTTLYYDASHLNHPGSQFLGKHFLDNYPEELTFF